LRSRFDRSTLTAMDVGIIALGTVIAVAVGLLSLAIRTSRGARLPGSFGQGFLRFRADGWPIGVQEDDDAHWSWPGATPAIGQFVARARVTRRPIPPSAPQRSR
jgi:hypothetical protein